MGQEQSLDGFQAAFSTQERKKLRARFKDVAGGRDHITKEDFLMMPEICPHPIINRVIDVVLEETGQATRRDFEGDRIEVHFSKDEYDLGIEWEAIPNRTEWVSNMRAPWRWDSFLEAATANRRSPNSLEV